jgi:hypothetical protein
MMSQIALQQNVCVLASAGVPMRPTTVLRNAKFITIYHDLNEWLVEEVKDDCIVILVDYVRLSEILGG